MSRKKICLVCPSIGAGGAERVMTQLATYFSKEEVLDVELLLLVKAEQFYKVPDNVKIHEPNFDYKQYTRPIFVLKIIRYLRQTVKGIQPDVILTFGGRYNSFVLLATKGLKVPVFLSDRSRPSISYGYLIDRVNNWLYPSAEGIIAQTSTSKNVTFNRISHQNIEVIGNPIRSIGGGEASPQKIILSVGRFIPSKKQETLLRIFARINPQDWKLVFVGGGEMLPEVEKTAETLGVRDKVIFAGQRKNVDDYFKKAAIFAFTSISEGFPNALGEAMNTPLPCVSFDIEAGPSDLIDDGENGYLVPLGDLALFEKRLRTLMENPDRRKKFKEKAKLKMEKFSLAAIGKKYYNFLTR